MLISEHYRKLNEQLHRDKPDWGATHNSTWIGPYLRGFISVLDYGAGKGNFHVQGIDFRRYDPAVPEYAADPKPADLVLCLTVMEHVEPECVDAVLDHIQSLSRKRVVFKVSCHESIVNLADGSNVHRSVHDANWWLRKCIDRWTLGFAQRTNRGFRFVGETVEQPRKGNANGGTG